MPILPLDEEPLDRFINRPLAKLTAAMLHPTPVTPNQVSAFAGLLGLLGGAAMCWGTPAWLCAGALLLWGQLIFDCADGELARRRGGGGWTGMVVDGIADYVVAVSIHVGLWAMLARAPGWSHQPWYVICGFVAATGFSMALHSALFDAAKQSFRIKLGKPAGWFEDPAKIQEEVRREGGLFKRLLLPFYRSYAASQRRFAAWIGQDAAASQSVFFAWCLLGPTVRVTLLAIVLLLSARVPGAIVIYPVYGLGICNVVMVLLLIRSRLGNRTALTRV